MKSETEGFFYSARWESLAKFRSQSLELIIILYGNYGYIIIIKDIQILFV